MEVVRTYLELTAPSAFCASSPPSLAARLRQLIRTDVTTWRTLYARVGERWQWHDRDAWSDDVLAEYLARSDVHAYAVDLETAPAQDGVGFLELCTHPEDGSVEIVYLGLVPDVFGHKLGGWLLAQAVDRAWAMGATRVWLHTCTLDGEAALPNYLARGFRITRTETYDHRAKGDLAE